MVRVKSSFGDQVFMGLVYVYLIAITLVALVPVLYVVSASFTPYSELLKRGGFILIPRKVTLDAYVHVFTKSAIPQAYKITVFITIVGTAMSLTLSALLAYPLSCKTLPFRKILTLFVLIPMVFRPGIIPKYINMRDLGLIDSVWSMIWGAAVIVYNVIVMKAFFQQMEESLYDAARIDGAGELHIFIRIVLPLSMPVMVTIGLFYGVQRWNEFLQAILFISDRSLHPLQPVLRNILSASTTMEEADVTIPVQTLKMAAVLVSTVPILLVYPFLQKHFVKGVLLGAVKG
jgi:putative aldouronate transport system permease protein